jgi:hypothetical protein
LGEAGTADICAALKEDIPIPIIAIRVAVNCGGHPSDRSLADAFTSLKKDMFHTDMCN